MRARVANADSGHFLNLYRRYERLMFHEPD